jgi:hypothetical protein
MGREFELRGAHPQRPFPSASMRDQHMDKRQDLIHLGRNGDEFGSKQLAEPAKSRLNPIVDNLFFLEEMSI